MADHEKPPPYNYGAIPQGDPNVMAPPPYSAPDTGPKPGYPPPPPQGMAVPPQGTTTIITQPAIFLNVAFREHPVSMICPHCQAHIVTATSYNDGTLTWLLAGGLCLVGCWLGCCLVPFCLDGCKDVIHTCPNCHVRLGVFRRI